MNLVNYLNKGTITGTGTVNSHNKLMALINKLINRGIIDLDQYNSIIIFLKQGCTLANFQAYIEMYDSVLCSITISDNTEAKDFKKEFIDYCSRYFSIVNKVCENNQLAKNKISDSIIKKSYISFTNDQINAINQTITFLCDRDEHTFGLYGYAGTGKTTLITKLIYFLLINKLIRSVVFSAPTNKAVDVMKDNFQNDIAGLLNKFLKNDVSSSIDDDLFKLENRGFRIHFLTIHKLLKYKQDYNAIGDSIFVGGKKNMLSKYDMVIIDECSMLPLKMVYDLYYNIDKELIDRKNPKIMFIGDPGQLNPVEEGPSVIFNNNINDFDRTFDKQMFNIIKHGLMTDDNVIHEVNNLKNKIIDKKSITLTQIVRSKSDLVTGLSNNLRKWIFDEINIPEPSKYVGDKVKLYKYKKGTDKTKTKWFRNCIKSYSDFNTLNSVSNNDPTKIKNCGNIILTWTNPQSDIYNKCLRETLFGREELNRFEIGDILMFNDYHSNNESNSVFYTSEQVRVIDLDEIEYVAPKIEIDIPASIEKMTGHVDIINKLKKTLKSINKNTNRRYNIWVLHIQKILSKDNGIYRIKVIKNTNNDNTTDEYILNNDKKYIEDQILRLRKYYYNNFKDKIDSLDRHIIVKLWRTLSKTLTDTFANVSYGLSTTTHKSQGSTYQTGVYVDVDDIFKNNNLNEVKRMIYTAVTRTSNEVHLLVTAVTQACNM